MKGNVVQRGGLAYVSQQAWIQNMTLRDNILFGNPYDEAKYNEVIRVCALIPDLKQLSAGDQVCLPSYSYLSSLSLYLSLSLSNKILFIGLPLGIGWTKATLKAVRLLVKLLRCGGFIAISEERI